MHITAGPAEGAGSLICIYVRIAAGPVGSEGSLTCIHVHVTAGPAGSAGSLTCKYVHITAGPVGSEGSSSLALEQEKYFSSIVAATPMGKCMVAHYVRKFSPFYLLTVM